MLQAVELPLQLLRDGELDDGTVFQPRVRGLSEEHLERLRASEPDRWPPLIVTPRPDGYYDVVDGFHRLSVARERGLASLPCNVVTGAGYPEAVEANLRHGLPLSREDRKEYARWLRREYPSWSYRQIGEKCSLHHETVKAAIEGDGTAGGNRQPGSASAGVRTLIRQMVRTRIVSGWRSPADRQNCVEDIRAELAGYDAEERQYAASTVAALSSLLLEAVELYLT
jgi:hypothetical protein